MANILDEINGLLSDQIISKTANHLGESDGNVSNAIRALLPTILGGLVQKSTDNNAFNRIFNLLSDNRNIGFLDNITDLINGGNLAHSDPKDVAGELMSNLFGNKVGGILDLVSNYAGIKKNASSSILGLVGPVVMGFLGKKINKEGLNSASLATYLGGQQKNILRALPAGMGSLLGFVGKGAPSTINDQNRGMNWWPWLTGVLALLAILYFWRSCQQNAKQPTNTTIENTTGGLVDSSAKTLENANETGGAPIANLGKFFKKKLACGIELSIPENGTEAKIVAFIEDKNKPVDKETWFTMDRLAFKQGESSLDMKQSAEQLRNIAEILKCYPNVVLKVGGYTDNLGKKEDNLKLSSNRANMVKATIIALGANPGSLQAEGYGDEYPKSGNDTEEGREQNRRIDIRVMAK